MFPRFSWNLHQSRNSADGGIEGSKKQQDGLYDPERQVVVLVVRDNGGTSGYLAGGPIPPPGASAVKKAKNN